MFSFSTQMAAILLALFALALPAQAAAPGTPKNFTATAEGNPQYIQLKWDANTDFDAAEGYNIYVTMGKSDNLDLFKLYGTQREGTKFSIKDVSTGTYTVFIRAFNADGESDRTDFRFVVIQKANSQLYVKFKTEPKRTATAGTEYVYESKAIGSTSDAKILYKLDGGYPDGMTIDVNTGVVRWTPTQDGIFKYTIIAYLSDNPDVKAMQTVEVKVGAFQSDAIRFESEGNRTASTGKLYNYQPKVVTNDPSVKVTFKLDYAPDGMTIDQNTGLISWTPSRDGEYKVIIVAYIAGTDIKAVQSFVIKVGEGNSGGDKDGIRFITKPVEIACLDKEYVYDAEAVSLAASPLAITYKLAFGPEGMTIDEKTGLIKWTPAREGEFKVGITASLLNSQLSATQSFALRVKTNCETSAPACAKIVGKVVDENGAPVSGSIKAIRLDKDVKGSASFSGKIYDGQYSIGVSEGNFALFVSGDGFVEEWYMDAVSIDKATSVGVKCDETVTVDFAVMHREKPKNVVVEGTVTNENGEAIFAMVEFIVKDPNGADNKGMMGRFVAKTNDKGVYRIEIPENLTVIAHAVPLGSDKYIDQYFEKVNNPEEATRLTFTQNTAINFVLAARASYQNGFAGLVRDSASVGINARVVAYRIVPANSTKEPGKYEAISVSTNEKGEFTVSNLVPGDYFLFAIPKEKQGFVPGYYKAADFAVAKWQDATRISVGEVMIDQVFEIILRSSYGMRGGAKLGGRISHRGGIAKAGAGVLGDAPLAGAYVIAYDASGNISDYIFSDDQGAYNLSELTAGTFTLTTDKPGFVSMQTTATVDYAKLANVQVDIVMDAQSVSGVEEDAVAAAGGLVFPNPATNQVNVRLNGSAGIVTVRVINTLGSEVLRFNAETSGDSIVSFDASNLPNGMYTLNIQNGNIPVSVPLTVIR